jgi:hypothetical protein
MRRLKILEYLAELQKDCEFFEVENEGEFIVGAIFSVDKTNNVATLEFVFPNMKFSSTDLIGAWWVILDSVFETWPLDHIESDIQRKHKRSNFVNWIKRYDTRCKLEKNKAIWNK